ncbi:hypothetical protein [Candidatus Thiodictyon syntrophicum]|jgi:hypothetical protein|uniref:PEP-CTERM protein-sorting domain-containing protein n=1 Tax=Candidatus Thiodictyon syntrophicum TaxID=1166950 RepID=A0A2K8UEA9_9GAMM|nr:hypothetical protein [Candidatus Thiodictyon syntrophicum]AUB83421.1 hypothetical protein THSYN_22375 [Candidatus Thiodictyon syntrophicum]
MQIFNPFRRGRWLAAVRVLAALSVLTIAFAAPANADCDVPQTPTFDKPFTATDVIASFADAECTLQKLTSDTVFYRYYSYPEAPSINIGRFLTTNLYEINSEAIVKLALYPFPPNVQFQNFAYYREQVLVKAQTELYVGLAGPQPAADTGSCYTGGASQYFFSGVDISTNPSFTFTWQAALTKDTNYVNQYGVGDPCNVVPLPGTLGLLGIGACLLLTRVNTRRRVSRPWS